MPVNAACGLNDTRTALFVLVDRAQGCTSLEDGQLEFLLHRRLFADDGKGLNEPLNETQGIEVQRRRTIRLGRGLTVTGTHYLVLQPTPVQTATNIVRSLQSRVYLPLHLVSSPMQAASVSAYLASHTATSSFLANALPPQLDLITLQALAPGRALVRFAHAFGRNGIDEGNFSTPVTLNLTTSPFTRATGQWEEVSLTANQKPVTQRAQLQWNIRGEGAAQGKEAAAARAALPAAGGSVLIDAMEVSLLLTPQPLDTSASASADRTTPLAHSHSSPRSSPAVLSAGEDLPGRLRHSLSLPRSPTIHRTASSRREAQLRVLPRPGALDAVQYTALWLLSTSPSVDVPTSCRMYSGHVY